MNYVALPRCNLSAIPQTLADHSLHTPLIGSSPLSAAGTQWDDEDLKERGTKRWRNGSMAWFILTQISASVWELDFASGIRYFLHLAI